MTAKRVYANDKVYYDAGKVAFQYGPTVFCVEGFDNGGDLASFFADSNGEIFVESLREAAKTLYATVDGYRAKNEDTIYFHKTKV